MDDTIEQSPDAIREAVRGRYGGIAKRQLEEAGTSTAACCGPAQAGDFPPCAHTMDCDI